MNLGALFPSPTISLYMARLFVFRTFALLGALVLVLTSLDLLTESAAILAHPGNGNAEILRYVTLRVPQIMQTFLPYSVLGARSSRSPSSTRTARSSRSSPAGFRRTRCSRR